MVWILFLSRKVYATSAGSDLVSSVAYKKDKVCLHIVT